MIDPNRPFSLFAKRAFHLFLLLTVFLLTVAILLTAIPISYNLIDNEKNYVLETPWQYSVNGEGFRAVTLPANENVIAGTPIIIKNRLPDERVQGETMLLRTSQQDVVVYVDGKNIYNSYDKDNNTPAPSSAYHFVRLPTDCAGKEIRVILCSPYKEYGGFLHQIYIGSKSSHLFFVFQENGIRFCIGFLIFGVGFLLMILFLCAKRQTRKSSIIYLGAFFLSAGYWVMAESKMLQFFFPYPMALTNSSIFAVTLLPAFLGLYYYNTHTKLLKKSGKYVLATVIITSLVFALMACIRPALPLSLLPFYLAFLVLYILAEFIVVLVESIKIGKLFSVSIAGMMIFGVFSLLELISYLKNVNAASHSYFLTIGLLIFCVAMVVDSIQNVAQVYRAAIKVDTLSVLAYTDGLTGLKNRTAFLEQVTDMDMTTEGLVSVAMFDINNLKKTNDTLGHLMGDSMLLHGAKAIRSSLRQEDLVYRIGGDEFVAIICRENEWQIDHLKDCFLEALAKENRKSLSYPLSIAYGYATFSLDTDKSLLETLARADQAMYACKKEQKGTLPTE